MISHPQVFAGGEKAREVSRMILGAAKGVIEEFGAEVLAVGKDLPLVGAAFGLLQMIASRAVQAKVGGT